MKKETKKHCAWAASSELMQTYHDTEWGVPKHDDIKIFEALLLDSFQAGLSWATILNKRENFRKVFDNFDPKKIARYDATKKAALMADAGIIRNRLKIKAATTNAKIFLEIQKEYGTFARYIWQFTNHKPIRGKWKTYLKIPASTKESDIMSKDLKRRGMSFVGTTMCYAFMQGIGMANDHETRCFRY